MRNVTDTHLIKILNEGGINPDDVEFVEDYSKEHPTTKIYKTPKGRIAVCQALPRVRHDGVKICGDAHNETTVGWTKVGKNYRGKPNIFSVNTVSTKVYLKRLDNQKRIEWSPQLFLGGVEKLCNQIPALLDDISNPNYHDNVLEWDYGICKRRLRVIEGAILERWVFLGNPNCDVRIKHNQSGELKLGFGEYQINDDEELVPKEVFDEAEYPLEIGGSLTVYSTASDADVGGTHTVYATIHDAATATVSRATAQFIYAMNYYTDPNYGIHRTFLFFVTSALGASASISAATLSIYGYSRTEADAGHSDLGIVEGIQDDPVATDDYGDHESKTTLGADTYYAYPIATDAYNDKALNSTGYGWISLTGTTRFCLRLQGDIGIGGDLGDGTVPAGLNRVGFYTEEKGAGFLPKLVITYTALTQQAVGEGAVTPTGALGLLIKPSTMGAGTETLRPNAAGDENAIENQYPADSFPATDHWNKVDEETPDGYTSYVSNYGTETYQRDLYNLPASSGSGTINFIKIYFRCCYDTTPSFAKPSLKSDSTVTDGTEVTVSADPTWTTYSEQWNTNPADGEAWEWADIDALQIGVSLKAGYSLATAYCTQVYVVVNCGGLAPVGTLARKMVVAVGSGVITPVGTLARKIAISIGGGSVTPTGALSAIKRFLQSVGAGSITPTGALSTIKRVFQNVGQGAITPVGTLGRKIAIAVGAGIITPVGHLIATPQEVVLRVIQAFTNLRTITDTVTKRTRQVFTNLRERTK